MVVFDGRHRARPSGSGPDGLIALVDLCLSVCPIELSSLSRARSAGSRKMGRVVTWSARAARVSREVSSSSRGDERGELNDRPQRLIARSEYSSRPALGCSGSSCGQLDPHVMTSVASSSTRPGFGRGRSNTATGGVPFLQPSTALPSTEPPQETVRPETLALSFPHTR